MKLLPTKTKISLIKSLAQSLTLARVTAVAVVSFTMVARADYDLYVDPTGKTPPRFSLELPTHHGNTVVTCSMPSQIKAPRCDTQPLQSLGAGRWRVPATCRRISWLINFEPPPKNLISKNFNFKTQCVAFPGWWSLISKSALLHLDGEKKPSQMTIHMAGYADQHVYTPSDCDAPEFYAVGHPQETIRLVDGVRVRYVADNLDAVTQRGLLDMHAKALKTLRRLFPTPSSQPFTNELLVILVSNHGEHSISGGSGGHSFTISYLPQAKWSDLFTLMTIAHEQFHQLTALHNSGSGTNWTQDYGIGSAWFAEGLAEYYGLKVVQQSQAPAADKAKVRNTFINPQRPVKEGLIALNRRFTAGDPSVYPLFYFQGATFFSELDQTLQKASGGKKSLDDFVPILHSNLDGSLPRDLLTQWHAIAGQSVDALVAHYVGQ